MVVLLMQEREADGVHRITVRLKMTHFKHYVQCTTYQYVLTTFYLYKRQMLPGAAAD